MRKALVLGASTNGRENIGKAIADHLERLGWTTDRHDCSTGSSAYNVPYHVNFDTDALVVSLGRVSMDPIDETDQGDVADVIWGCLTLPILCARTYVQARGGRGGKIVFIGSYAHNHPLTNSVPYCSAKAGLDMAGRALGWELTDRGFSVHVVHPYHVRGTPMYEEVQEGVTKAKGISRAEAEAYAEKDLKMPALSTPRDVAAAVAMLLEQRAAVWMSGTNIELYGGTR